MKKEKIKWIVIFNLIIIFSEIFFGILSNSYALISDAMHNFGDIISLIITYLTINLSIKANKRATIFNILFLYTTMFYMIYEAIVRFDNPAIIEARFMIIVGLIALVANGISAYLLSQMQVGSCSSHHKHCHQNNNIKSAYLHMLSDALISFGVIVGGIVIYFYQIYFIDSILTIIVSFYIIWHSYPLLKSSLV